MTQIRQHQCLCMQCTSNWIQPVWLNSVRVQMKWNSFKLLKSMPATWLPIVHIFLHLATCIDNHPLKWCNTINTVRQRTIKRYAIFNCFNDTQWRPFRQNSSQWDWWLNSESKVRLSCSYVRGWLQTKFYVHQSKHRKVQF